MPDNSSLFEPFTDAECEIILQARSNGNFDLGSILRTYKLLRRLNCDVFHCHTDHTSPLIGATLAKVPVRIWSTLAMSSYHEKMTQPRGIHRLMPGIRLSYYCTHRILAISEDVRNELIGFGVSEKRIDVVHVPVDVERFSMKPGNKVRHELGLNPSHIMITSVGRAIYRKGWDIDIKAFSRVQNRFPNARLVLVGSTDAPDEIKFFNDLTELCRSYKVSEYVYFLGHRHNIPEILKESDISILPSRSEGLGCALLEAMAAGLPCVAARVGGPSDVITHGKNGFLFERESTEQLVECLTELIRDETLKDKIASHAFIRAQDFSMESYANKVFSIYQSLLDSRKDNKCPASLES
jgi:glycosyltransferase involved in cell wall biosynthesis